MAKPLFQVGRKLSDLVIAAYECVDDSSGIKKGKRVRQWYGMFHEERLKEEVMPKLDEYAELRGFTYPFLITTYRLEGKTDVRIRGDHKPVRAKDVRFAPRQRNTPQQFEAVVYSRSNYQLLR